MIGIDIIRSVFDYNYAVQQKVWDSIMTLTDEQFTTEVPYSLGSVRNHMVHLATVDTRWLGGLQGVPDSRSFNYEPADYPTRESARALCEKVAGEVMAYISTLDDDALQQYPKDIPLKVWQVLLHVANHGTDHRSQVLRVLHDLGAPTFPQDLVFHFFEQIQG